MGQEITSNCFKQIDFDRFYTALEQETRALQAVFKQQAFSTHEMMAGLEMEAWLIDKDFQPAPVNEAFFKLAQSDYLTPELSRYNIELNVDPVSLKQDVLSRLAIDTEQHWKHCQQVAEQLNIDVLAIGILPTLKDTELTIDKMSRMARYQALNEQVLKNRDGKPINLHIIGKENLKTIHFDVMLEASTTSLQIHIQTPQDKSVDVYNSSIILSAPMVAASANSPFMFGKNLWAETRIPVFEQAVESGGYASASQGPLHRVSFGSGYCKNSLFECFEENLEHFPVLLPMQFDTEITAFSHLRLHNGTVWRWNRPLIGFDDDATPHLRIEHRVIPGGPTIADQVANIALYYGLVNYFITHVPDSTQQLDFASSKDNFYQAARHGLDAHVYWPGSRHISLRKLFDEILLEQAHQGLDELGIATKDRDYYLGIIEARIHRQQTGSEWQRKFTEYQGNDMRLLTQQYLINQKTGIPVHEWDYQTTC